MKSPEVKSFLLFVIIGAIAVLGIVGLARADTVNGVLAEERVVNLPNDQGKWYVSVVGNVNDATYLRVLGWFNTNASLKSLKNKVHFCQVTNDTAIYKERYAGNVKALPTVRVQKSDGTVVYEVSGKSIPMTASGLYGAMANGADIAEGARPVLPWRRGMEKRCPGPCPQPQPQPQPDPEPQPIDDGTAPSVEPSGGMPVVELIGILLACVIAGAAVGLVVQWKKTYSEM